MLLLIDLLCYYFTKWRIFYWIAVVMIISYLAILAFVIGMYIGVYQDGLEFYRESLNMLRSFQELFIKSKEIERLKSRIRFDKALIDIYDNMNFISKSNNYDKKIEQYQKDLSKIYKRIQELKEEENK